MSDLGFSLHHQGDLTTLSLVGKLDVITAPTLEPTVHEIVEAKPPRVEVDLAELELIDSAGVATLVGLYKRVRAEGGTFKVIDAQDQPLAIFKLLRMDKVFL
jgi:anti-sigma B factor antagonist